MLLDGVLADEGPGRDLLSGKPRAYQLRDLLLARGEHVPHWQPPWLRGIGWVDQRECRVTGPDQLDRLDDDLPARARLHDVRRDDPAIVSPQRFAGLPDVRGDHIGEAAARLPGSCHRVDEDRFAVSR